MRAASKLKCTVFAALGIVLAGVSGARASELASPPGEASSTERASEALPPLRFVSDAIGNELYSQLRQAPRFKNLDRDIVGSAIELRVHHSFGLSEGGKVSGTASGLLAAGTLGLVPQVYSGQHSITYELRVNGAIVTSYTYRKSLARVHNMWSTDTTHGLGKDGEAWAASTVDQFLSDSASDAKFAELIAEYRYYFGSAQN